MTGLVDDLLDVSRVTRGLVGLDRAALELNQIVIEAIEQSMPLIRARGHELALQLHDTSLVMGDHKRLIQVVANLLNNAAKYTPENGKILVRTESADAHIYLHVIDNGIGIAPALIDRMFDLFAQAEVTSARSSGGLGLGLALVRSLVELHGGTVKCTSMGIGEGSSFTICLPLLPESGKAPEAHPPAQSRPIAIRPMRLLIVDDNVDAATMLGLQLEAAGHEVFIEHSPQRALARVRVDVPDACILDIGLPEMDGNELARRLRGEAHSAALLLIAVTGYGQEQDRRLSLQAGFDHHLVKPVDTAKLSMILAGAR